MADQRDEEFDFPEPPEGLVKPEDDSVVAFLDGPDQAEAAIEQLVDEGFDPDRIYVLCGTKGAQRLDVSGAHHGLRAASTACSSGSATRKASSSGPETTSRPAVSS